MSQEKRTHCAAGHLLTPETSYLKVRKNGWRHLACRICDRAYKLKYHKSHPAPMYVCWRGMIDRCLKPHNHAYGRYGGRGITICAQIRFMVSLWRPSSLLLPAVSFSRSKAVGHRLFNTREWR